MVFGQAIYRFQSICSGWVPFSLFMYDAVVILLFFTSDSIVGNIHSSSSTKS
uniref:Uncharacterized protein n=1 Tax=Arundo donax TaxID=35708 RepID=A0A0A9FU23_ARUDO